MISVVLNTYNHSTSLFWVLFGYTQQTNKDFEIIIVDDGSSDNGLQHIEHSEFDKLKITVVSHTHTVGRVATCFNNGLRLANGERILFTQGDVIPCPDFIEQHSQHIDSNIVCPGPMHLLAENYLLTKSIIRNNDYQDYEIDVRVREKTFAEWVDVQHEPWHFIWTSNVSCAKQSLLDIGGLCEEFNGLWGGHDTDLGYRLSLLGCQFKSLIDAPVYHIWHKSLRPPEDGKGWIPAQHILVKKFHDYHDGSWKYPNE